MSWLFHDRHAPAAPHCEACWGRSLLRIVALMATILPNPSAEAEVDPRLAVDASVAYSNNPLLIEGRGRSALIAEVTVRPSIEIDEGRGSSVAVDAAVTTRQYSRRYGNFLLGDIEARGVYRQDERLSARATARFDRAILADELTSDITATLEPRTVRESYSGKVALDWRPSAYEEVTPEVRVAKTRYPGSALARDTSTVESRIAYARRTDPYTRVGGWFGTTFNRIAGAPDFATLAGAATIERRLSEHWRASAELGAERVASTRIRMPEGWTRQPARLLFAGRAQICREGERLTLCANTHLSSEVTGLGGLQRRLTTGITANRRLGERLTASFTGEYQHASIRRATFPALDSLQASARLDWTLTRSLNLGGIIDFRRRELASGRSVRAGYAGLQLRYDWRRR